MYQRQKVKSFSKKSAIFALLIIVSAILLISACIISQKAYGTQNTVVFSNYKNQKAQRGDVTFTDVGSGQNLDALALYKKAVEYQLDDWALVACGIYSDTPDRSSKDSCMNMWDDHHQDGKQWSSFNSKTYTNIFDRLRGVLTGRKDAGGHGDVSNSDGLKFGNSLHDAAYGLCELLDDNNRESQHADAFMTHVHLEPLISNTDKQTVLYTNAAVQDEEGSSGKKHYSAFGICFYDFKINLLSTENTDTLTGGAKIPYESEICIDEHGNPISSSSDSSVMQTITHNEGSSPTTSDCLIEQEDTSSVTAESSYGETVSYGEQIGFDFNFGHAIGDSGNHSSSSAATLRFDFTFNQAYSKAFSDSKTTTSTDKKSLTTSITTPPHTAVASVISMNDSHFQERVYTPISISYKVAVYCCSGRFYDIGASSGNWKPYDQNGFATFFGDDSSTDNSALTFGDAHTDLFLRAKIHGDEPDYDHSVGKIYADVESSPSLKPTAVQWKNVKSDTTVYSNGKTPNDAINSLVNNYAMSYDGATMDCRPINSTIKVNEAVPLYKIKYINPEVDSSEPINMSVNSHAEINYKIRAIDEKNGDYYGFNSNTDGQWEIVDANGNKTQSSIANIKTDARGISSIHATAPGTVYIKYFIKENHLKTYDDPNIYGDDGQYSTNNEIISNALKIEIKNPVDQTTIPASIKVNGTPTVEIGQTNNLNTIYDVSVYNYAEKEIISPITWEQQELESRGIHVEPNGNVTTTQEGIFHVKANANGASGVVSSEWVELNSVNNLVQGTNPQSNSTQQNTNNNNISTPGKIQPTEDLLNLVMSACGKVKEGSKASVKPSVSASTTYIKDGIQTTITTDDVKARFNELGISKDEFYALIIAFNIGKRNGKIPTEIISEVDAFTENILDNGQKSHIQANARALAINNGWFYQE